MEAGPWTGQGYSAPWMYHSVAGQYTLLEKHLVSDCSCSCPCRGRPGSRVLQDSTNWHHAPLPARWGPSKQEGHWFPGKQLSRTAKGQGPCSPAEDGLRPVRRRDLGWGQWGASPTAKEDPAARAAASCRWNQAAQGKSNTDALPRAPPSYEDHLLLRLRAGERPRKENWPRPPPYVAPPAYEAPHRRVQPQQRACGREASGVQQSPPGAPQRCRERAGGCRAQAEAQAAAPGGKAGRRRAQLPRGWSYLSGATTWAGAGVKPGSAAWSWRAPPAAPDRSPQRRSHTLPRISKRSECHMLPDGASQHALPAGWGFSHAAGRPGALGHGGKRGRADPLPRCKGPSPAGAPQRPSGGLFVIDATCVVIQAHYVPAPRTERVRYLGQEGAAGKVKAATAPCSPARLSMEERAARILGLPLGDLGFPQTAGKAPAPEITGHRLGESCPTDVAVQVGAYRAGQPGGLPSPRHSPRKPPLAPTPSSFQVGATEPELEGCPDRREASLPCQGDEGCPPQSEEEPLVSAPGRSYVQDLKEAMLRIRRHTAPDSDTDEELEKECEPAWGQSKAWRGHQNEGTLPYSSSSSSLESSGSNATVVPGNTTPTLRKGLQSNLELMLSTGNKVGQAVP